MSVALTIASDCVSASILLDGGILWEPRFRLDDGRWVMPLARAAWADDPDATDAGDPAYIRRLGGAFLALPFGGRAIETATGGWAAAAGEAPLHGLCATGTWQVVAQGEDRVTIALDFPPDDAVTRVEQAFSCATDAARIDLTVTIHARRAQPVAAGWHPILRLPDTPGALELRADFARGHTGPLPNETARITHDTSFDRLKQIPAKAGGTIDLAHLPGYDPAEELLLLGRVAGPIVARYHDAGHDLVLDWDRALLPNCLIWYHDRAADVLPWNSAFRGLGLEPSASAFDLAAATSCGPNPLTEAGERTSITLSPDAPTIITCSLSVEALA